MITPEPERRDRMNLLMEMDQIKLIEDAKPLSLDEIMAYPKTLARIQREDLHYIGFVNEPDSEEKDNALKACLCSSTDEHLMIYRLLKTLKLERDKRVELEAQVKDRC